MATPLPKAKRPSKKLIELKPLAVNPEDKKRARKIVRKLLKEYPDARVMLNHKNSWELMVGTILAAQCTDARVNIITPALFKKFGTPQKMSVANIRTLEKLVHSAGFFRAKARNLKAASLIITNNFHGKMPRTMAEMLTLPGVARKTANVLLGDMGIPSGVVVDTHNIRLTNLFGFIDSKEPVAIEQFWLGAILKKDWIMLGHLLYSHGQQVCVARRPNCADCVLGELCPSMKEV